MISMREGGTVKSGEKPSSAHWDQVSSLISCSSLAAKTCHSFCLPLSFVPQSVCHCRILKFGNLKVSYTF